MPAPKGKGDGLRAAQSGFFQQAGGRALSFPAVSLAASTWRSPCHHHRGSLPFGFLTLIRFRSALDLGSPSHSDPGFSSFLSLLPHTLHPCCESPRIFDFFPPSQPYLHSIFSPFLSIACIIHFFSSTLLCLHLPVEPWLFHIVFYLALPPNPPSQALPYPGSL